MKKRVYAKPTLTMRTIALGVFGNYGAGPEGSGTGGSHGPHTGKGPTDLLRDAQ